MKRTSSPLLWVCAAMAALLGLLVWLNPGGVYAVYRRQLPPGTPAVAAVFTAAQDGVLPWSSPAPAQPASPAPPMVEPDDDPPAEPVDAPPVFTAVDASYFDDALFLGDSRIEGLSLYGRLSNATYYWQRGLTVWSALDRAFIPDEGETLTVPEALTRRTFGKIYLMLGVNELGKGTTDSFAAQYGTLVDALRRLQPEATIYILASFHVTQEKSQTSIYRNDVIDQRNAAIARFADGKQVFYLDSNPVFDGEDGALIPEYTGDGVHLMAPYYVLWRDDLMAHGIIKNDTARS